VLDLGAAPGSWSLYAAERVGRKGAVVAVDLQEIRGIAAENVFVVQGDALALSVSSSPEPESDASSLDDPIRLHGPYDIVLSDMAPSTTGSKSSDQARSFELFMKALAVARAVGKPGAAFVGKIFMSGDFPEAKRAVNEAFETCRILKPEGTRSNSSEIFVVGTGKR
jgi:23S rRNA (uridine2552-2'-O)-methyltransferase